MTDGPFTHVVRLNQIGAGLNVSLEPDAAERTAIARSLDLASLASFRADIEVAPSASGWKMSGHLLADLEQACVVTLEPLPVRIDSRFRIDLVEAGDPDERELDLDLERDDPDVVEDGQIDLGAYAVEQLALQLDPFPRKAGVEFVQPDEPVEMSPFAVLRGRISDNPSDS